MRLSEDIIYSTLFNLLKIKFETKVFSNENNLKNEKENFEKNILSLSQYIFNYFEESDKISINLIKWIHRNFYPKWTIINTYRDWKHYKNIPGEWRLHESLSTENNHGHSLQKDIENDLIKATNLYNSILNKKRTDILKYYFDFLKIHPFADSNLTTISIICELEFFKYWFKSLNFLKTRFNDWKFNYFFLYEYENNKEKPWILEKIEKIIDDFFDWKLPQDITEKKEKINIKSTQEIFWWKMEINYNISPYFQELKKVIENYFVNLPITTPDYELRKIVYNNTLHYLESAFFRNNENVHQNILNWYYHDMERIILFLKENILNNSGKLDIETIKLFHKNLYPNWFIHKNKDINWKEFIQMIPGEFRNINLIAKEFNNKDLYYKWMEVEKWLKDVVSSFNNSRKQINDILLFMTDFITVHPFWDGNWRVADILTDLLLLKNWFEPIYFWYLKQKDKTWFYEVRNKVAETKDIKYFYEFIKKNK